MPVPAHPKLYHICHVDRLASIVADGFLWSDAVIAERTPPGTTIGMNQIKQRRLSELTLTSHSGLHVGQCVPFYFCPRSIMLYLIFRANHPELAYHGGQGSIVHLRFDLHAVVAWANGEGCRWAFTLSNAGANYFEDRARLDALAEVNWDAVAATDWRAPAMKEGKQAEFLVERSVPWDLVELVGVHSEGVCRQAAAAMPADGHRPPIEIKRDWYY
jgi:hypothetical protein